MRRILVTVGILVTTALSLTVREVHAQTRVREVATMVAGGNTVRIRAESTGQVIVSVSRSVVQVSWSEFSPTFGDLLAQADAALNVDPSIKPAPGEVVEYDSPFFKDRWNHRLRLSRRHRAAGSSYVVFLSDDTGVQSTATIMTAVQYQTFRAALDRAVKLAYDMMG